MSSLRPFTALDLFRFNRANLDPLTENYDVSFYLSYLARWPTLFTAVESAAGNIMGYIMGKAEGRGTSWHGHVTAVTVAPNYRRLGLAKTMMDELERVTDAVYRGYFVDLFVRVSNDIAIRLYEGIGYSVYRRVVDYYNASKPDEKDEDAFDMRKPMKRDKKRESVRENGRDHLVSPDDVW